MDQIELKTVIARQRTAYERGRVALVMGPLGAIDGPSCAGLVQTLGATFDPPPSTAQGLPPGAARAAIDWRSALGIIASAYASRYGAESLRREVVSAFAGARKRDELVRAVVELARGGLSALVTLGQDGEVVQALSDAGVPMNNLLGSPEAIESGHLNVVELFGSVKHPDSLVLTSVELASRLSATSVAAKALRRIFVENEVLLLHAVPHDPAIIAACLGPMEAGSSRWVVALGPTEIEAAAWQEQGWIRVTSGPQTPRDEDSFIIWLLQQVRKGRIYETKPGVHRSAPPQAALRSDPVPTPKGPPAGGSPLRPSDSGENRALTPNELLHVAKTLEEVAADVPLSLGQAAQCVNLRLDPAWKDDWERFVRAVHAGKSKSLGDKRVAVSRLVDAVSEFAQGSSRLHHLLDELRQAQQPPERDR